MAAEEQILKLFDSYWFHCKIFSPKPPLSTPEPNPVLEIHEQLDQEPNLPLIIIPTLHVRSLSDHYLRSDSLSPSSILPTPKLQTILSGKEAGKFSEPTVETPEKKKKKVGARRRRGRRKKKGLINGSKSLSELEFEELKGFMDLGFVFCEEDKNSSLGSIIPGLQRLGRKGKIGINDDDDDVHEGEEEEEEEEEVKGVGESAISRPYLSEAWGILESPLMNWRVPEVGNEMDMKDHLRIWAHTVASTVR